MKLTQHKIKWLARLMLGMLLFAQGIVAANACVAPNASPVQAYAMSQHDGAAPCHETETPNTNACLMHCGQDGQISADHHSMTIAAPASTVTWIEPFPQVQHYHPEYTSQGVALDTGPPIPIRFCSLLN